MCEKVRPGRRGDRRPFQRDQRFSRVLGPNGVPIEGAGSLWATGGSFSRRRGPKHLEVNNENVLAITLD